MSKSQNEKRVETLESKQQQPDFVPARWVTMKEGEALEDEEYAAEEASGIDIAEEERKDRERGTPEWIIRLRQDQRADYYRRKEKKEAEAQKRATDNYLPS